LVGVDGVCGEMGHNLTQFPAMEPCSLLSDVTCMENTETDTLCHFRTVRCTGGKAHCSANADGHARLYSINFERPLWSRQFEILIEYIVP
jgi:hypothetical protein